MIISAIEEDANLRTGPTGTIYVRLDQPKTKRRPSPQKSTDIPIPKIALVVYSSCFFLATVV